MSDPETPEITTISRGPSKAAPREARPINPRGLQAVFARAFAQMFGWMLGALVLCAGTIVTVAVGFDVSFKLAAILCVAVLGAFVVLALFLAIFRDGLW
jgi:hypothetical protein